MPSPAGLFLDSSIFTLDVLNALITSAKDRILKGDFTNMSGAEKSHSKQWALPPDRVLIEANYAKRVLTGQKRATTVTQVFPNAAYPP